MYTKQLPSFDEVALSNGVSHTPYASQSAFTAESTASLTWSWIISIKMSSFSGLVIASFRTASSIAAVGPVSAGVLHRRSPLAPICYHTPLPRNWHSRYDYTGVLIRECRVESLELGKAGSIFHVIGKDAYTRTVVSL